MFKKIIVTAVMIMTVVTIPACGLEKFNKSPNVYGGRYTYEEINNYVTKITDLKNGTVKFETKDGDETYWFKNNPEWDEVVTWDDIYVNSWDNSSTTWDDV